MCRAKLVMENTSFCRWFLVLLLCFDSQGCLEVERAALLQIKDSMTSPEEFAFSNWYTEECLLLLTFLTISCMEHYPDNCAI
ncbi:hypothetical protein HRI_002511700 [Hibiscus trionum]|uniref:Leucine-rich repeat-containing N-terminal plant-type domain-containing protein n=1 Tax=Hibiscus trionum TaxID=183268 RepID=A0A9W7I1A1_HIBTR|nr:hypothetical protein HRI_002511700 [Hibiscus trionum]